MPAAVVGAGLPPDTITVQSEVGGSGTLKLSKGLDATKYSAAGVPFAQDDVRSVVASSGSVNIAVTVNDIVNSCRTHFPNSRGFWCPQLQLQVQPLLVRK